jgi:hypothetical protein
VIELEQIKDRANLELMNSAVTDNNYELNLISDSLSAETTKEILRESSSLKSIIDNDDNISLPDDYIDSVMTEFEILEDLENINLSNTYSKTLPPQATFTHAENNDNGIADDPHLAKFRPLLNKDLKLKIKDLKSNLGAMPKVLFNKFLRRFKKDDYIKNKQQLGTEQEFNIHSELIREKLKLLPQDKADKARKFAYSLISKNLATGYAAGLTKYELAKQLIHHAVNWKPTKLGSISREKEIDTALAVAWKAIAGGTWQMPLELAKAQVLQYEFRYYRHKYQQSGILSHEIKSLEIAVSNLLGAWHNLATKITKTDGKRAGDNVTHNSKDIYTNNTYINKSLASEFNERLINNNYKLEARESVYQQNSSLPEGSNGNYQPDYDYLDYSEIEPQTSNFNLFHVPDEQKYLKIIPSSQDGDDHIKLETINGREYFVKLKALEMNDCGELVMTLKPSAIQDFISLSKKIKNGMIHNSLNSCMTKTAWQAYSLEGNIAENYLPAKNKLQDTIPQIELNLLNDTKDLKTIGGDSGAVRIDEIIANILKNIRTNS